MSKVVSVESSSRSQIEPNTISTAVEDKPLRTPVTEIFDDVTKQAQKQYNDKVYMQYSGDKEKVRYPNPKFNPKGKGLRQNPKVSQPDLLVHEDQEKVTVKEVGQIIQDNKNTYKDEKGEGENVDADFELAKTSDEPNTIPVGGGGVGDADKRSQQQIPRVKLIKVPVNNDPSMKTAQNAKRIRCLNCPKILFTFSGFDRHVCAKGKLCQCLHCSLFLTKAENLKRHWNNSCEGLGRKPKRGHSSTIFGHDNETNNEFSSTRTYKTRSSRRRETLSGPETNTAVNFATDKTDYDDMPTLFPQVPVSILSLGDDFEIDNFDVPGKEQVNNVDKLEPVSNVVPIEDAKKVKELSRHNQLDSDSDESEEYEKNRKRIKYINTTSSPRSPYQQQQQQHKPKNQNTQQHHYTDHQEPECQELEIYSTREDNESGSRNQRRTTSNALTMHSSSRIDNREVMRNQSDQALQARLDSYNATVIKIIEMQNIQQ